MKSILDPSFKYTSSLHTDIAKTFARIRRMQRQAADASVAQAVDCSQNVAMFQPLSRAKNKVA